MSQIKHHIPEPMLVAYAAGSLQQPFALVVAAHVSLCDEPPLAKALVIIEAV